ncbi:hypothetical protein [Pectobacterium phage Zenivior_B1]|uniref:Uncharacterized protein n=2 Tax=Phimunavirus zenivior TaxID=2733345 RepID=A0A3G8FJW5_9CAUD|nr:hypothetical protein HOU75_gp19 [Pectobacterium phage Zenivior]AZF94980.1 hypothetical protein [Pectobacterium phage Zenivior]AZF95061.1 hypothetical protein [Pectobacterium phage Zenivior_B1]
MNQNKLNPETLLMNSRAALEINTKAVQAELKAMYIRKAWRVGLSLEEYCRRFHVQLT